MRLLKIMFATVLVLDAALIMTTSTMVATSPFQAVGLSTDVDNSTVATATSLR